MPKSTRRKRLLDAYRLPGFCPREPVRGIFGDPQARVVKLVRRSKKPLVAAAGEFTPDGTTGGRGGCEESLQIARTGGSTSC